MIEKNKLENLYLKSKKSTREISKHFNCSENRINYWLSKFNIKKRSISESIYLKANPNGDPFIIKKPRSKDEYFLYGLGLGLYWGEGNKKNKNSVRLGNTDPRLIKKFIEFLERNFEIDKNKLHFGLQIFGDMDKIQALNFWKKYLHTDESKFQKIIVTPRRGVGNYREKTKYGVLTVYFNNVKLRNIICNTIENL